MNIFEELEKDIRFEEGLRACINCGTCTAICPAAQFYEYDPRLVADMIQRKNEADLLYLLKSDIIWYCGECLSCKTRCPRDNVPAYIIQALKTLSIKTGNFVKSIKGRQQLALVRTVGRHILEDGYCVHIDKINTELFPEQGPVWDWTKQNIHTLSNKVGANYRGEGSGSLRNIPKESIKELHAIFEITGGKDFFMHIEQTSENYAKKHQLSFEQGSSSDEYFTKVFNGEF